MSVNYVAKVIVGFQFEINPDGTGNLNGINKLTVEEVKDIQENDFFQKLNFWGCENNDSDLGYNDKWEIGILGVELVEHDDICSISFSHEISTKIPNDVDQFARDYQLTPKFFLLSYAF